MKITGCKDWYHKDYLKLGAQTKAGMEKQVMLWKARAWAPDNAKSFSIENFNYTTYEDFPIDYLLGFASARIVYFTTKEEGKFKIYPNYPDTYPSRYVEFGEFRPVMRKGYPALDTTFAETRIY